MSTRRSFLLGLGAALAAPAIVRAESLMKIASLRQTLTKETLELALVMEWEKYRRGRLGYVDIYRQMVPLVYGGEITVQEFYDA